MLEENQAFNSEAQEEREKEKQDPTYTKKKLCAPHLRVFTALVQGAATKPEGDTLLAEDRKAAHAFWVQTVMKITNPEELADTIRYCKAKRVKTKSPEGEDMVK
eukprot:6841325-Pyramimonas_sp.AAC.1